MQTSASITNITPAFLKAQKKIESVIKDSTNPYFKSKYADLTSVIEACKKHLNDVGIAVLQPINGEMVETVLLHESGEWFGSATPIVSKSANDPQALGSAISYAKRYGLQSMVLLPAVDDDGNQAANKVKIEIFDKEAEQQPVDLVNGVYADEKPVQEPKCAIHGVFMKERTGLHGGHYFDHRKQIDGVWNTCNGSGYKSQNK